MKNHILIFEHEILKYPPILSVINFLKKEQDYKLIIIGYCSNQDFIEKLSNSGIQFYNVINNNTSSNWIRKFFRLLKFKHAVSKLLKRYKATETTLWLFGETCIWLTYKHVFVFSSILYLFEVPNFVVAKKYRLLSWNIDYKKTLKNAFKIVCCEYNRAHIVKAFFDLKELPLIIPNKPLLDSASIIEQFDQRFVGKKIILYQGIFNYPERRMDELCEAVNLLPDEFILCLMGSENSYKKELKERYESERIIFLPFIESPHHLEITQQAYIGYLTYTPISSNIQNILNTLYCAPNKIFEYSMFSIPMISNDIPALNYSLHSFNAGLTCNNERDALLNIILTIDKNYPEFQKGAKMLYESIEIDILLSDIFN